MVTSTVSWPEIVWSVITFVGLVFCMRISARATIDLISIRVRRINSIREYAAVTTVVAFASWACVQFIFFVIGIIAMLTPNLSHTVSVQQYVLLALFLVGSALFSWAAFAVERRRGMLLKKLVDIESGFDDD